MQRVTNNSNGKGGIRLPAGRAVPRENHPLDGFLTRGLRILADHQKAKEASQMGCLLYLAEREGFEPSVGY